LPTTRFVLDGELIIPGKSFEILQLRLHPAASRVVQLSRQTPARFIAFDLLADADGHSLLRRPFTERRSALEAFFRVNGANSTFFLSKATRSQATAQKWLKQLGRGLDGIMVKEPGLSYRPGQRVMRKFKVWRTVDCVVGGVTYRSGATTASELLLGLYDDDGRLNFVGRCAVRANADEIGRLLRALIGGTGFSWRRPERKKPLDGRSTTPPRCFNRAW
jgi:ATP-dependent DNA ligase